MYFSFGALVVQHRFRPSRSARRLSLALLITGFAQLPVTADQPGLQLRAPINSTFKIRAAERSWETESAEPRRRDRTVAAPPPVASPGRNERPSSDPTLRISSAPSPPGSDSPPSGRRTFDQVNDGWVAREAVNAVTPLRDPAPQTPRASEDAVAKDAAKRDELGARLRETAPAPKDEPQTAETGQRRQGASESELPSDGETMPELAAPQTEPSADENQRERGGLSPTDPPSLAPVESAPGEGDAGWVSRHAQEDSESDPQEAGRDREPNRAEPEHSSRGGAGDQAAPAEASPLRPASPGADLPSQREEVPNGPSGRRQGRASEITSGRSSREEGQQDSPATIEADRSTAKSDSSEALREGRDEATRSDDRDEIVVRPLRIGRDGSLAAEGRARSDRTDRPLTRRAEQESTPGRLDEKPAAESAVADDRPSRLDYTGRPTSPLELNETVRRLEPGLRRCLEYYFARPEQAHERSNWGMMHAIMVYGVDTPIRAGRRQHSAIAWIAGNNACRGKRLLTTGRDGIEARDGVGLQGHQAQFLAILALAGVPADYPLYAGGEKYSVRDLVEVEASGCRPGEELTFSLIGLSHYLSTDDAWTSADGERWDFERLIREELAQPIVGSACGGTHRLMGFAHALRKRRSEGRPITGQWSRADEFLRDFVDYAYQLQNRDGSMSTNWFEGREDNGDLDRKVQTTGHIVEWLLTVTPDSELQDPRLVRAIRFLLAAMYNRRGHDWSIGPKGHALRSLAMYYERVYQAGPAWRSEHSSRSTARSSTAARR